MKAEGFGFKNGWVTVRSTDHLAISKALGLRDVESAEWDAGLAAAYEYPITCGVFMTPPIDGWTLIVGYPFCKLANARDMHFGVRIAEWAKDLGCEVQFFATHRGVDAHAWGRAFPDGRVRAFSCSADDGVLLDEGEPTPEERAIRGIKRPSEVHVMALAAKWSVDPSGFDERDLEVGPGKLAQFGEHPPVAAAEVPEPKPWWKFW